MSLYRRKEFVAFCLLSEPDKQEEQKMEEMVNKSKIKSLRVAKAWSQDQLATISGLSLRTIQRIENEGKCSFESKRALAASFEVELEELDDNEKLKKGLGVLERHKHAFVILGLTVCLFFAYQQLFLVKNTLTILIQGKGYRGLSTHSIVLSNNESKVISLDAGHHLQVTAKAGWKKELHMVLKNKDDTVLHVAKLLNIQPALYIVCDDKLYLYQSPIKEGNPNCPLLD